MNKTKKKKSLKRELIEWGAFLGIAGILYITGLHTEVIGGLQRVILKTGIIKPKTEVKAENVIKANYDFTLVSMEGKTVPFDDFKNKVVFMNFWATWCPPCIAEMPEIQNLYEDYKNNENVAFVMVNLDEDVSKAKSFLEKKDFDFPVFKLASALPNVYESQSIPTTFVISPEGNIVSTHKGMASYDNKKFREFLDSL